jgi:glycogen operon protein
VELLHRSQIQWHGVKLNQPDWGPDSVSLAFTARGRGEYFHTILNTFWKPLRFKLPPSPGGPKNGWMRVIDTHRLSPEDICRREDAPKVRGTTYLVQPRSVVLLVAEDEVGTWEPTSGRTLVNLLPADEAEP